jgi:hypothetical protein
MNIEFRMSRGGILSILIKKINCHESQAISLRQVLARAIPPFDILQFGVQVLEFRVPRIGINVRAYLNPEP